MIKTSFREHRELGEVAWLRDYDAALGKAAASGKPVLLLFQEIPGCSTCVNFGHDVLANPLLAELIEDRFVPLAIYNNQPGRDAEVLRYFGEPAWNNPVVHFLSPSGQDIVPKLANRYDPIGLHGKILTALEALGQDVPEYARLLRGDLLVEFGFSRQLVFETPCFWSGETTLAQHPAVLTTEAGWSGGEEVVRVHFDPALSDASALEAFAVDEGFAPSAGTSFETDKATQYYVSSSPFAFLPLSAAQRTRINLAIPYRDGPERFLSPHQHGWLSSGHLAKWSTKRAYQGDFHRQWKQLRDAIPTSGASVT